MDSLTPEDSVPGLLDPSVCQMLPKPPFEEIFLPHLDAAYNLARWILDSDPEAQDAVQEAYSLARKNLRKFSGDNPRLWLLTIVSRTASKRAKKLVPSNKQFGATSSEKSAAKPSLEEPTPQLQQILAGLTAELREILVLAEIEGWSYQEIATALEVPLETVISRLSHARRLLLEELTHTPDGDLAK